MLSSTAQRTGVLIGGSGLIGGTLLNHFKNVERSRVRILSPNSKELSLRVPQDIRSYFERVKPHFIINCAIASIDSDPQLTFEVTSMGTAYLARAAQELGIPYIHFSSAAVMPNGRDLREEARLELRPELSNYAKGKLLAEMALERMHETRGLDYTIIRLAVVYGAHDHKIQGFHRLLFSLVDESMPFLLTRRDSTHSYTNSEKLPFFVSHVLDHRPEFSGQTYHFVDPEPVPLGKLILTIKSMLGTRKPRAVYVPYGLARLILATLNRVARLATRVGIEARPPAEAMFLKNFYDSQVLSSEKLRRSSFVDPEPQTTVFTELPDLIQYYVRRWENLNLIEPRSGRVGQLEDRADQFRRCPERLLSSLLAEDEDFFLQQCSLVAPPPETDESPADEAKDEAEEIAKVARRAKGAGR